jgi:hypothetical protein
MTEEENMNFMPALIAALMVVESGGICSSIGDGGKALGCLQIHKGVIADVNRIYKTWFRHEDALNPALAKEICEMYLRYWAEPACRGVASEQRPEICARIWNGGPAGHKKASTLGYWAKVRRELQSGKGTEAQRQNFGSKRKTAGPAALALP